MLLAFALFYIGIGYCYLGADYDKIIMVKMIVPMLVIVFYVENKVFALYGIIKKWKIDVDGTIYFIIICNNCAMWCSIILT